jgi:opacity protein-like surface antigen
MTNRSSGLTLLMLTLVTLALAATAIATSAQTPTAPRMQPEAQGYLLIGGIGLDLDGINRSLGAQGFGEIGGEMFSMGGGGHVLLGRWVLGAEGFGLFPREADTPGGDWRARFTGGGGLVNVGYSVVRTGGTSIYPLLGMGVGALTLQLTEQSSPTFDDVLNNPGRGSTLNRVVMLVQPAIGLDHFVPLREVEGMIAGMVVGVRAGYTFTPVTSRWYLDTMRLAGSPDQGMDGAFVRVMIGGGSRRPAGTGLATTP